jgi:hypothetical protein
MPSVNYPITPTSFDREDSMANGRMLNKSISTHPEFNAMSVDARELYLKTLPHLDRDGLITGHPSKLWATIDPFHADRLSRMGEYIQEWINAGLVIAYDTGRERVLFFKGFRKSNPNIKYDKEAASPYPPPSGWIRSRAGLVPDDPDMRQVMAQSYDPRSSYREALITPDATTPPAPDNPPPTPAAHRGAAPPTHALQFGVDTLTETARQLGPLVFGADWQGDYEMYITTLDTSALLTLLEWLAHFSQADYSTYEDIKSLPAFVRKCVANLSRPQMNSRQRQGMIDQIAEIDQQVRIRR